MKNKFDCQDAFFYIGVQIKIQLLSIFITQNSKLINFKNKIERF